MGLSCRTLGDDKFWC